MSNLWVSFVQDNLVLFITSGYALYKTTLQYYLWVLFVQDNLAILPLGTLCTRQFCNITSVYSLYKTTLQYYLCVLFVQDNLAILPLGTLCARQPCNITPGYSVQDNLAILPLGTLCSLQNSLLLLLPTELTLKPLSDASYTSWQFCYRC